MGEEDCRVDGDETRHAIVPVPASSQALQQQETEGKDEQWQVFYDETSYDQPVPWWFNSVTGESTWECPIPVPSSSDFDPQPGEVTAVWRQDDNYDGETQQQHIAAVGTALEEDLWGEPQEAYNSTLAVATVGAATDQGISSAVSHWSEEFQAYYNVHDITRGSSWEPAVEPRIATSSGKNDSREASTDCIEQQNLAGTLLTAWTEDNKAEVGYTVGAVAQIEEDLERDSVPCPHHSVDSCPPYPHFVNERGNRVFCVQRRHAWPS